MRLPFFNSGRASGPIRLKLPESVPVGRAVYFRSQRPEPPSAGQLLPVVRAGIERRAREPLRSALLQFVERGLVRIEVGERSLVPEAPLELLRAWSPGEAEERRFREATHVVAVEALDLLGLPRFGLWATLAAGAALAEAAGGVALDPDFPRLLPIDSHGGEIPGDGRIRVAEHILVPQSVGDRGLLWVTTKGLAKLGLPELEVTDAPPNLAAPLCSLINGIGQCLAARVWELARQGGTPRELVVGPELRVGIGDVAAAFGEGSFESLPEGTQGWTEVGLQHVPGGRNRDDFLRVVPPRGVREKPPVWLNGVLQDLFGPAEDAVRNVRADSEAMEAAHLRAVSEIPYARQRFQAGLRPGEMLAVKHGFPTGGDQHEFMWLAVTAWRGDRLQAQLMNQPEARLDLRPGQVVELREADLFDWILTRPDGEPEGGYTNRVLEREGRG